MKVTHVHLHPDGSFVDDVVLSYMDPFRALPYNIKGITGLDADEIVHKYYHSTTVSRYYELSMQKRTLVFLLELNPNFTTNETYSLLRDNIYRMIASSRKGKIQIHFHNESVVVAQATGKLIKVEAPLFTQTPEIQLTIECDNPFLTAPDDVVVDVDSLNPLSTTITDTISTAMHGFQFVIQFNDSFDDFVIVDPNDTESEFRISRPFDPFVSGDYIFFSSEANNKYVYLFQGNPATMVGDIFHLADLINPGSVWPILFPGANQFVIENGADFTWYSITHKSTFWGI